MIKVIRKCDTCDGEIDISFQVKDDLNKINDILENEGLRHGVEAFYKRMEAFTKLMNEKYYECWTCETKRHNNFEAP